jgi:death-on-curing protein
MKRKPVWVREDIVLAIHRRQIAEHGGLEGIRDSKLLESALARPKNLYLYNKPKATIPMLAASYAYGLTKNHPFVDGNKRVAFTICRLFLKLNGVDLKTNQIEKYKIFMKLASGKLTENKLAEWISNNLT